VESCSSKLREVAAVPGVKGLDQLVDSQRHYGAGARGSPNARLRQRAGSDVAFPVVGLSAGERSRGVRRPAVRGRSRDSWPSPGLSTVISRDRTCISRHSADRAGRWRVNHRTIWRNGRPAVEGWPGSLRPRGVRWVRRAEMMASAGVRDAGPVHARRKRAGSSAVGSSAREATATGGGRTEVIGRLEVVRPTHETLGSATPPRECPALGGPTFHQSGSRGPSGCNPRTRS
jgi:hypothetical protein